MVAWGWKGDRHNTTASSVSYRHKFTSLLVSRCKDVGSVQKGSDSVTNQSHENHIFFNLWFNNTSYTSYFND